MNLFDVYPQLAHEQCAALSDRSLRLIALSALVYDDGALYFELGPKKLWGRLPGGGFSIGVSTLKVQPDPHNAPQRLLAIQLRKQWHCEVEAPVSGDVYVLDENRQVVVLETSTADLPSLFILTPPRLGGGDEVPDALVQAVYALPLRRWRGKSRGVNLLRVQRSALSRFLEARDWDLADLTSQSWAEFLSVQPLPKVAHVRPVLALRGIQHLLQAVALPINLGSLVIEKGDTV
jgi:hypothetical protein